MNTSSDLHSTEAVNMEIHMLHIKVTFKSKRTDRISIKKNPKNKPVNIKLKKAKFSKTADLRNNSDKFLYFYWNSAGAN